ncbi:TPA: hypothetical protein ACNBVW_005234, partial [Escherichia coli]
SFHSTILNKKSQVEKLALYPRPEGRGFTAHWIMLLALEAFCLMAKRWFVSCRVAESRKPRS